MFSSVIPAQIHCRQFRGNRAYHEKPCTVAAATTPCDSRKNAYMGGGMVTANHENPEMRLLVTPAQAGIQAVCRDTGFHRYHTKAGIQVLEALPDSRFCRGW